MTQAYLTLSEVLGHVDLLLRDGASWSEVEDDGVVPLPRRLGALLDLRQVRDVGAVVVLGARGRAANHASRISVELRASRWRAG